MQSSDITENMDLLQIRKGNDVIFQKFDENIYKVFLFECITYIDYKGLTYTFSLKNIYDQLNQFELRVIIISFIAMLLLILSLNFILDKTILNPIISIEKKINKIVTVKKVPISGDHRITVDFNQNIDYADKDEIGNIAKSFNNLLFLLKKQQKFSKNALTNICSTVMNILGHYHSITRGHSYRTALIATAIAVRMGFKDDELENIFYGSILHDIGKISVDKNVLMKPGKFNDKERKEMERHPGLGYKIALDFPLLSEIELLIIRDHHERLSGKGYPLGLKGNEISPAAKIAAAADIFDAIICPRDYKKARPVNKAMDIINDISGPWLDKKIIKVLKNLLSKEIIVVNCNLPDENKWITVNEDKLGTQVDYLNINTDLYDKE